MTGQRIRMPIDELRQLALEACLACGSSQAMAKALIDATLSAARFGRPELGFPHSVDYLASLREGRINGNAKPRFNHVLPALIQADADGGIAQLGFDLIYDDFTKRVKTFGISVFTQKNSYTAGELGYYIRRLAQDGLISIAAANGPPLMAAAEGGERVYCTNPLAFGAPMPAPLPPLVIDQATSATAFVTLAEAAKAQSPIAHGIAIDETGAITTDPVKAMLGALLPFGGYKGANIALVVEMLSAGLSGAAWSLDAGHFLSGEHPVNAGMTVIALFPAAVDPDFQARATAQLERLRAKGVRIPGDRAMSACTAETDSLEVDAAVLETIRRLCLQ
ncbi:malate dehydrogenase [Rhizobium anhuiense]|uniref:Malate dehydrogenase n=1 Tax=Rhizobium anhuiense TaxID=1184720 RepID=A0ABX4IYT9_9HYPH|nr:Ldh family oxidoreductase [Rhizobium anhuiense]PDS47386.1 malate dehydrogenase [Rhizobium anhuiense]